MSSLNFFKFLFFFIFSCLIISCDGEKEDVNEKFSWDYTINTVGGQTTFEYNSPDYHILQSDSNHVIKGYPNAEDSIEIVLGNLFGHELKVGEYKFGFGDYTSLTLFRNGEVLRANSGVLNLSYINNRMDFDFEGTFLNGSFLESGIADNLLIGQEGTSDTTDTPTTIEIGTIEAKVDGALFKWNKEDCLGTLNTSILAISGSNLANTISLTMVELSSDQKINNAIGKVLTLDGITNNLSYSTATKTYITKSGQIRVESYKDNIITMSFNAVLANIADATDQIPVVDGKVEALKLQ